MSAGPPGADAPVTRISAVPWSFAEVVVEIPNASPRPAEGLRDAFTYGIPEPLRGVVAPGHAVWVPFGRRRLQGVVVALSRVSPVARTRDIAALADERPWLSPAAIALARWIGEHYRAPFFECLRAMMPPGAPVREVRRFARTPASPSFDDEAETGALSDDERSILGRFGKARSLPEDELVAALGRRRRAARAALASLQARGLLEPEVARDRPAVRARRERILRRIDLSPEEEDDRLLAVKRKARSIAAHAEALGYLASSGDVAPASEVLRATAATARTIAQLEAAGLVVSGERRVWRDPVSEAPSGKTHRPELTEDQARAIATIDAQLGHASYAGGDEPSMSFQARAAVCLVHGVTGSGKTELYLGAIERVLLQGRQAIVLVPEIALTAQTIDRFASRFPGRVGLWHSEMSEGERFDTWQRARDGNLDIVVGSRSAIFAPLPRLGLVVVDEEHADSYKQGRTPRYHARDVAVQRAALSGALVILGSATPAVTSFWRAARGEWTLIELPRRVGAGAHGDPGPPSASVAPDTPGAVGSAATAATRLSAEAAGLPPVSIVDMRAELRSGNTSIFSRELRDAVAATLGAGEQAILFLNRRGRATFVMCRDCGTVIACPRCDVPLTDHGDHGAGSGILVCHRCNHREAPPMLCPGCGGSRIRYFGTGTEKVEAELRGAFPEARVVRWDADTTGRKGAHAAILARFAGGSADILVGTQMITKGLDLPLVTLVGVISADTALHFPDFRSTERAFQSLAQVAGRAGRAERGGRAIFQTYSPDHPAIRFAAAHDFAGFYESEIAFRAAHRYPPWRALVRLEHISTGGDADAKGKAAGDVLKEALESQIRRLGLAETEVVGPAPAFFHRIRGKTRWQLVVLSPDPHALLDAIDLPPGWRVDVDPIDLL